MHAKLQFGDAHWEVTFNEDTTTAAYRAAQFAFEAKRAAERSTK